MYRRGKQVVGQDLRGSINGGLYYDGAMKKWVRALVSVGVSAGIVVLVLCAADTSAGEVLLAVANLGLVTWGLYIAAQLGQGWLRAVRYRLLLGGAGVEPPGAARMFGVALARNMFVDMLPARAGELMYWALLNRGEGVRNEACVSSMTISVLFDFVALALVLAGVLVAPLATAGGRGILVWSMGGVLLVVLVGAVALSIGPAWAAAVFRRLPARWQQWRAVAWVEEFMDKLTDSFRQVGRSGVLWRAAGLSVGIRAVKYLGLLAAFVGVAGILRPALAGLPVWQVLVGLISGEGGAALPVPTFLSMGSYEAAGAGALRLTGVSAADAALVLLGTHVASQVVDYALGGLGLLGLLWGGRKRVAWAAGIALLLLVLAAGGAVKWRAQQKAGAREAPPAGEVLPMEPEARAALERAWGGRTGFIVWSSTMFGNHELVRLDWPSGQITRLTQNGVVDSTPKISPDGRQVVFARSRREWVSCRNFTDWDIWVLDLASGKEHRVAEFGVEPSWTGDGRAVVFQRGGQSVLQVDLQTGKEAVLLAPQGKLQWTGPSMDPRGGRVAVTVRGGRRGTSLFSVPDGHETRVAGGCQLAFVPGGEWLVLVEDGGRLKNRICRVDRDGRNVQTLLDMPGEWSHEYFPRVSNDGGLLVFGASRGDHEHDTADYEIFLWPLGALPEQAARVSFHTGNDQWPDIWVQPAAQP